MKKAGWILPVLVIAGVGYYLWKKKSASAAITTNTTGQSAAASNTGAYVASVNLSLSSVTPTVLSPIAVGNTLPTASGLTPLTPLPAYDAFTTNNPFLSMLPGP